MAMMTPEMRNNYIASQQKRYTDEYSKGNKADKSLLNRLTQDLKKYNAMPQANKSAIQQGSNKVDYNALYANLPQETKNRILGSTEKNPPAVVQPATNTSPFTMNQSGNSGQMTPAQPVYQTNPSGFTYDPSKDARFAQYFSTPAAFSYDAKLDPLYQTMLQNALAGARSNAKQAQQNALESLNERGISNSSIAATQLAQIEQDALTGAQSNLESSLLPQLMNQAYQRYSDDLANKRYQSDLLRGLSSDAFNQYMASLDNQRADKTLGMQEAGLTGVYNQKPTLQAKNQADQLAIQQAGLTGMYQGKETMDTLNNNRDYEIQRGQLLGTLDGKQTLGSRQLQEDIRSNKAAENSRAVNAAANMTRAQTASTKAANSINTSKTDQRRMTANQQQTFVQKSINPLLVDELGQDAFEFDYKTGRNVLKEGSTNQFIEVMSGIRDSGLVDDSIIRLAFTQYGVQIPNGFIAETNVLNDRDIISFPGTATTSKSNTLGINPAYLK